MRSLVNKSTKWNVKYIKGDVFYNFLFENDLN